LGKKGSQISKLLFLAADFLEVTANGREAQDRWVEMLVLMKQLSWQLQSL